VTHPLFNYLHMTLSLKKKLHMRAITSSLASLVLVALKTLGLLKNPCSNFKSLLQLDHFGLEISTIITCRILSSPGHQGFSLLSLGWKCKLTNEIIPGLHTLCVHTCVWSKKLAFGDKTVRSKCENFTKWWALRGLFYTPLLNPKV
jgi:hypothetical protein